MRSAKTPPSSEYSAGAAILNLPLEVQHAIFYTDNEVYFKWPLLCKQAAVTSRFDNSLNKHGKFRQWLKKGRLWERHEYIVENNKKQGIYKVWHQKGHLARTYHYKDDKKEGVALMWHFNGQMYSKCTYKNGKKDGEYKLWYCNGQQSLNCFCKDDLLHGEEKRWNSKGELIYTRNYVNGTRC
mmetsp:Transcript_28307/g.31453  ORF Transcript_28307/g.31453 Transcript_28307/m.31453 type:complete len:183 (-) Transcript_28307:158-706(-)